MIICELHMKNFGRFSDKKIDLAPGINLVTGRNEAGKSTAAQFVKAMFFGMKKGRGRAAGKDMFQHYAPWNGSNPEGAMVFSCNGRTFKLNRRFPDGEELFCVDDGELLSVAEGDLEMLLGGVSEGLYRNAVYTGAGDLFPGEDLSERLGSYLLNMESTKEEQADVQVATAYLKALKKEAESEYRMQYRMRQERLDKLRIQMEEARSDAADIREKQKQLEDKYESDRESLESGTEEKPSLPGLLQAAFCGLLAVIFVTMDHMIPGVVMAVIGIILLFAGGKRTTNSEEETYKVFEKSELEYRIKKEHLEEDYMDEVRSFRNYEEQYRRALEPGKEELKWQQKAGDCEMAIGKIKEAAEVLASGWSGRLEELASEILSGITGGRYYGLKIGSRMCLSVTDGERVLRPDQLSFGTREQIWVSVRLAAAMFLSEEDMPLVFDDAFLSWDDFRLSAMLRWLEGCGRQILLFSGSAREERILKENGLKYTKIILDE